MNENDKPMPTMKQRLAVANAQRAARAPMRQPDWRQHAVAALGVVVGMAFSTLVYVVAVIVEAVAS